MTEGALPQSLPRHINPRKMAYSGVSLGGKVDAGSLTMLAGAVDFIGDVDVSLTFSISDQGKMVVEGKVSAELGHQCQRCLQTMPVRSEVADVAACIVRNEDEAKQLPTLLDPWLVADEEADLYAFVEEELLLILPVVAYHDNQCVDLGELGSEADDAESDERPNNPFSVLSALREDVKSKSE